MGQRTALRVKGVDALQNLKVVQQRLVHGLALLFTLGPDLDEAVVSLAVVARSQRPSQPTVPQRGRWSARGADAAQTKLATPYAVGVHTHARARTHTDLVHADRDGLVHEVADAHELGAQRLLQL